MLVALQNGIRIEAWSAEKGPEYRCPKCNSVMTLRKGAIVIHHFAHKPPVTCSWATGETKAHLAGKRILQEGFRARGLRAEVEVEVLSSGGDRRADVLVWSRDGSVQVALEVQHQPILFDAIETRTCAYMAAGIGVIWVGLLGEKAFEAGLPLADGYRIDCYVVRPWERWAHTYGMGELWFVRVEDGTLWRGKFLPHLIEVPLSSWYGEGGVEESAGGYTRVSRKWRDLRLHGPYEPKTVSIKRYRRKVYESQNYSIPAGIAARLVAPE